MATKLARPHYAISRIDQPEKKHHGWFVRIQIEGIIHAKFFADSIYKGKDGALKAARKHRDALISTLSPERQARLKSKPRQVPQSGTKGVTHVVVVTKGDEEREFWQAAWKDSAGRRRTKKFSVTELGPRKSLKMAKDFMAQVAKGGSPRATRQATKSPR